jgi:hypothetical protein
MDVGIVGTSRHQTPALHILYALGIDTQVISASHAGYLI